MVNATASASGRRPLDMKVLITASGTSHSSQTGAPCRRKYKMVAAVIITYINACNPVMAAALMPKIFIHQPWAYGCTGG